MDMNNRERQEKRLVNDACETNEYQVFQPNSDFRELQFFSLDSGLY